MKNNYLQASKFVLHPIAPLLNFGTVGQGERVAAQTFTIDSVADTDGTIRCDADWVIVSPDTFTKGQNTVNVQLATEKLRKGEEYEAQLVVALSPHSGEFGYEKEMVEVRVAVRRYNDEDIAAMATRLTLAEQQFAAILRQNQQLREQLHQLLRSKTPNKEEKQIHADLEEVKDLKTDDAAKSNIIRPAKHITEDKDFPSPRPTISVDPDGRGDFTTIRRALDAAEGGEEILVKAGTYHEDNIHLKSGITLKGEGADKTKIISEGQAFLIPHASDVRVTGFRVQGKFIGFYIAESHNVTIERNIIINCDTCGITNYGNCNNLSVRSNVVINNFVGIRMSGDSGFIIKNNIISHNSTGINGDNATWQEIGYNNFYNNKVNCVGCTKSETDISINPMFVAPEEEDFRLKPSSPCINAGENGKTMGAVMR